MRGDAGNRGAGDADVARRFRAKIAGLKRAKRFVMSRDSAKEADKLRGILELLAPDPFTGATIDPCTGAMLAADFIETERMTFERCDDSNGIIQDVYWFDAIATFVTFASKCSDHDALSDRVLELQQDDGWGIRTELVRKASEYLPEGHLRALMERCAEHAAAEEATAAQAAVEEDTASPRPSWQREAWFKRVALLARQLGEPEAFERARRADAHGGEDVDFDIAIVYAENGMHTRALEALAKLNGKWGRSWIGETVSESSVDQLLLDIYGELGEETKRTEVAWRYFRRHRTPESLGVLVGVVGPAERDSVVESEVATILAADDLSLSDAAFLIDLGRTSAAEEYIVARHAQIEGEYYPTLRKLAKAFEADDYPLGASVIYRALITSILDQGKSKVYRYAASDLRKLDRLAASIASWGAAPTHQAFREALRERHRRKQSFWSRYEG